VARADPRDWRLGANSGSWKNTVSELFELLWHIYHFWNPAADDFHIERDFPSPDAAVVRLHCINWSAPPA
jgi:hypothetical protein